MGGAERNLWLHFGYGNIEAVYGNLGSFNFYIDDIKLALPGSIQTDIPALKDVYADYFEIRAAVEPKHLSGVHKELLDYHYNSLVAENVMKPESLSPRGNL